MKLFKMFVDDIICTVHCDPVEYLKFAKPIHNKLQITLKKANKEGDLIFLDLNGNVRSKIISPVIGIKKQLTRG